MSASDAAPRKLRLAFVGWGAIAIRVAELLAERRPAGVEIAAVAVRDPAKPRPGLPETVHLLHAPEDLAGLGIDMVIEVAGRQAAAEWGEAALRHAGRFVPCSISAFCDDALLARIVETAGRLGGRVLVPSGALGDIGALAAAARLPLSEVTHTVVKPPQAWKGTPAADTLDLDSLTECTAFFSGSAREAATRFPNNANVAAISALAGIGLDRTRIVLVADPAVSRNVHEISASGAFGKLDMRLENEALADNPKSSEMTALSLVRLIENAVSALVI